MSHEKVDLLIIMLGTNDTKERLGQNPACIAIGLERLVQKAKCIPAWRGMPNILVICPPHIGRGLWDEPMGKGCPEKSEVLAKYFAQKAVANGCAFLDAEGIAEFNTVDYMHLTHKGHASLAEKLSELVPGLIP